MRNIYIKTRALLLASVIGLLLGTAAEATPLGTTTNPYPDLAGLFIDMEYTASTDTFTASDNFLSSFALTLDATPTIYNIDSGTLSLSAIIDDLGVFSSGSITVGGTIAALGFNSGTLLTGTLTALGFPDTGAQAQVLEFLFDVTGGDAAGLYGSTAYIVMQGSGFPLSWTNDFDDGGFGSPLDILVPEPSTVSLLAGGLALLAWRKRRA